MKAWFSWESGGIITGTKPLLQYLERSFDADGSRTTGQSAEPMQQLLLLLQPSTEGWLSIYLPLFLSFVRTVPANRSNKSDQQL